MDTKRAIEILKARLEYVAEINIDVIMAYKMAIESLEKQTPKKVVRRDAGSVDVYTEYCCPNCNREVLSDYCRCGQNLNWEE